MLDAEIPLVDFRVARIGRIQAVVIWQAPQCQRMVGTALRKRQSIRERIREGRKPRLKIVFGKANGGGVPERSSGELEIRGDVQTVINASPAANHSVWIQRVCESQA